MRISAQTITRRLAPGLLLGFLVLAGLAMLGDIQSVRRSLLQFRWEYFFVALGFTLLNYALRFLKWHYYLGQVGVRNISWANSLRLFVAGFPLAVTPGKVGEALKGVWLKRISNLPVGRGISVVLAERISDGIAVMLLATVGVFAYPQYWFAFALILSGLVLVVVLSQIRPAALYFLGLGEKLPVIKNMTRSLREFYEGSYSLFRPGSMLVAVGLGVISWLGEGIGFYYILRGLGLPDTPELLPTAVFILSFSTAVGAASTMPGGLGAAEGTIAVMLPLIIGVSPAIAASATLLIRLATLWFGVGLGLITWMFSMDLLGLNSERGVVVESS